MMLFRFLRRRFLPCRYRSESKYRTSCMRARFLVATLRQCYPRSLGYSFFGSGYHGVEQLYFCVPVVTFPTYAEKEFRNKFIIALDGQVRSWFRRRTGEPCPSSPTIMIRGVSILIYKPARSTGTRGSKLYDRVLSLRYRRKRDARENEPFLEEVGMYAHGTHVHDVRGEENMHVSATKPGLFMPFMLFCVCIY